MFMYSLTIQAPTAISHAVLGQFSGTKEQQIVTACGSRITLNRPDATQGKIVPILSHDVFGIIRGLAAFKLAGSNKGMLKSISPRFWHLVILQSTWSRRSRRNDYSGEAKESMRIDWDTLNNAESLQIISSYLPIRGV